MSLVRRMAGALSTRAVEGGTMPSGWAGSTSVQPSSWGEVTLDDGEANWSASSTAYRCIQSIASNAASLRLQVREADDATVEGHWLAELWERPNPLLSRRVLAEVLWARLEQRGQVFVYVNRGPTGAGRPEELWPVWGQVTPVVAGREDPTVAGGVERTLVGYQAMVNGHRVGLLPEEVLWLRYPDPRTEWGALSPLGAAGHAIELDAYARAWQRGEFRNGAKPSHVVYLGDLSRDQHAAAVESWRSSVQGAHNAGKSLLMSGPQRTHVDRITLSAEEMSWLDTRRVTSEEVMLAFGVPKDYLLGGATYENRAASRATLWSDTIIPKLEVVASEMTRQLLAGEAPRRARFDTDDVDALQEGADAKAKRTTDLTAHDVLTLDEARAEVGLDELPGGLGALTLTAYRAAIQVQAQGALLALPVAGDRSNLLALRPPGAGRATPAGPSAPLLLPSGVRVHGPDVETILAEYDRHERAIGKATARLAKRQEAVVVTNAKRLLGGKAKKSQAWLADTTAASLAYAAATTDEERLAADLALRANVEDLFDPDHWEPETRDALEPSVGGAWEAGALNLAKSLGLDFSKFDLLVLTAMDGRLDVLANLVTLTTRQVLEDRVLLQGVAAGESIDQLVARIRGVFSDLSSWRAATIARTETVGGYNRASLVIAESSGVVAEREWLATDDARTRDSHREVDGDRVKGFAARYGNGCLHPGDPTASPEETINCRCAELYVTVD